MSDGYPASHKSPEPLLPFNIILWFYELYLSQFYQLDK